MLIKKYAIVGAAALMLGGCANYGPKQIKNGTYPYNEAIVYTEKEQMLLNIVRLRYRETPYFLSVDSVTASYNMEASIKHDNTIRIGGSSSEAHSWGFDPNLIFSNHPTISYRPMKSAEFTQRMMEPVALDTLLQVSRSGWSIERVFNVFVDRINDFDNAHAAIGPAPDYVPVYEEFQELTRIMRSMQVAGEIEFGSALRENQPKSFMVLNEQAMESLERQELYRKLGLGDRTRIVQLSTELFDAPNSERINVKTRSLLEAMFFLSLGIEVPHEDYINGVISAASDGKGGYSDLHEVLGGLLTVSWSKQCPCNAYVKVKYRNGWFYIADNDLQSKSTFMMLMKMMNLKTGEEAVSLPVLTYSVN